MRRGAALAAAVLLSAACRRAAVVRPGDAVQVHYELSAGGAVVESTFGQAPVAVAQGSGQLPPGADAALLGMAAGEERRVELPPEKAFGPRDPARVQSLPLADFRELAAGLNPGMKVQGFRDGKAETGIVLSAGGGKATLDFNHPLAGKTVVYRLRVVSIGPAR